MTLTLWCIASRIGSSQAGNHSTNVASSLRTILNSSALIDIIFSEGCYEKGKPDGLSRRGCLHQLLARALRQLSVDHHYCDGIGRARGDVQRRDQVLRREIRS